MLRALLIALALTSCGPADTGERTKPQGVLEYPAERFPADVEVGDGPAVDDVDTALALFESHEAEMTRQRRNGSSFVLRIINIDDDDPVWTVIGIAGSHDEATENESERWIAHRVRKAWDGQDIVDWADSEQCDGFTEHLSEVVQVRPPAIAPPPSPIERASDAKLTMIPAREFTIWTNWAPGYDLRFSGGPDSDVGRWVTGMVIALQSCWSRTEPR